MIKKFPNSGIRIMQDVHQIEAFGIPLHVELTELLGFDFNLVQNCVQRWDRPHATHGLQDSTEPWAIGCRASTQSVARCWHSWLTTCYWQPCPGGWMLFYAVSVSSMPTCLVNLLIIICEQAVPRYQITLFELTREFFIFQRMPSLSLSRLPRRTAFILPSRVVSST